MTLEFPASTYPDSIFKPRKPDESQSLGDDPTFNVLLKGYKTRSVIYERMLPDNISTALKIQDLEVLTQLQFLIIKVRLNL